MKTRRHHNNKGQRQIKEGKTFDQVVNMARKIFGEKAIKISGSQIQIRPAR